MRNSQRKFAALMMSKFKRHDLDASDFTYDIAKNGETVLFEDSTSGDTYVKKVDLNAMQNGDQITFVFRKEYEIANFVTSPLAFGMAFPTRATVSGVVTIYCIDGELYV